MITKTKQRGDLGLLPLWSLYKVVWKTVVKQQKLMKYSKGKAFTRSNINITATTIIITRITIAKINSYSWK